MKESFRAWCEFNKKMYYGWMDQWGCMNWNGDYYTLPDGKIYNIMRCTGLKDKERSREVYEHDILTNGSGNFYRIERDYKDTGWCGIQINNTKKHRLVNLLLKDSIIVGNIHENPELLNTKDNK